MSEILSPSQENIQRAAQAIREGKVVGMPTETVYGLAGNALDESALTRIFSTKERPTFDPLIVHVSFEVGSVADPLGELERRGLVDPRALASLAQERVRSLLRTFWPGPLTLVLPKKPTVPDLATSGMATVAVRMPKHPVARALIETSGVPLAAPSANRFGRISPTSADDVQSELGDRIELILDGGDCEVGVESTVLAVEGNGALTLLRPGQVTAPEIEACAQAPVHVQASSSSAPGLKEGTGMASPGMLASHYAPRKPMFILDGPSQSWSASPLPPEAQAKMSSAGSQGSLGLMVFGDAGSAAAKLEKLGGFPVVARSLSPTGNLEEAARKLFSTMRALDELDSVQVILAEPCPSLSGLGHAISDRMRRASTRV